MIRVNDYYVSRGFQENEYSIDEFKQRLKQIPPVHRLSFIMGFDVKIDNLYPFTDIVPGLKDYLSKSGIFEGYFE